MTGVAGVASGGGRRVGDWLGAALSSNAPPGPSPNAAASSSPVQLPPTPPPQPLPLVFNGGPNPPTAPTSNPGSTPRPAPNSSSSSPAPIFSASSPARSSGSSPSASSSSSSSMGSFYDPLLSLLGGPSLVPKSLPPGFKALEVFPPSSIQAPSYHFFFDILSYLPLERVGRLAVVSRGFSELVSLYFECLLRLQIPAGLHSGHLEEVFSRCPNLAFVDLGFSALIENEDDIYMMLDALPNLMEFRWFATATVADLIEPGSGAEEFLSEITIDLSQPQEKQLITDGSLAEQYPNLRSLKVRFGRLGRAVPKIRHLEFLSLFGMSFEGKKNPLENIPRGLKRLSLVQVAFKTPLWSPPPRFAHLEVLQLHACGPLDSASFAKLRFPKLKSLMVHEKSLTPEALISFVSTHLSQLIVLDVSFQGDDALSQIHCESGSPPSVLRHLLLDTAQGISLCTLAGFTNLISQTPLVTRLIVECKVSAKVLPLHLPSLSRLKSLELRSLRDATQETFDTLARRCHNLTNLAWGPDAQAVAEGEVLRLRFPNLVKHVVYEPFPHRLLVEASDKLAEFRLESPPPTYQEKKKEYSPVRSLEFGGLCPNLCRLTVDVGDVVPSGFWKTLFHSMNMHAPNLRHLSVGMDSEELRAEVVLVNRPFFLGNRADFGCAMTTFIESLIFRFESYFDGNPQILRSVLASTMAEIVEHRNESFYLLSNLKNLSRIYFHDLGDADNICTFHALSTQWPKVGSEIVALVHLRSFLAVEIQYVNVPEDA